MGEMRYYTSKSTRQVWISDYGSDTLLYQDPRSSALRFEIMEKPAYSSTLHELIFGMARTQKTCLFFMKIKPGQRVA